MKHFFLSKKTACVTGVILALAASLLCLHLLLRPGTLASEAPDVDESIISARLEMLEASDAVFVENRPYDVLPGSNNPNEGRIYAIYHSDSTGCDYYFDADFGNLKRIWNDPSFYALPEETDLHRTFPDEVNTARLEKVMKLAENCIVPDQIGTLVAQNESYNGLYFDYTIVELLDGIETGTSMAISCTAEGEVLSCSVHQGSAASTGHAQVQHIEEKISEEEAIDLAKKAIEEEMREYDDPLDVSCTLKTRKNVSLYEVQILLQEKPYLVKYYIYVDSHTGEILETAVTL